MHHPDLLDGWATFCCENQSMAGIGGGFIYLAAHAVLGEILRHGKQLVLASFSVGFALIGILNVGLRAIM
jgi:zinc transporter ZupT